MNKDNVNQNSIGEMERIQRGLEEFLQQELREMQSGETQSKSEPQLFTIGEEENGEEEIDIIGASDKNNRRNGSRSVQEDFFEDWDSADYRRSSQHDSASRRGSSGKSSEGGSRKSSKSNGGKSSSQKSSRGKHSESGSRRNSADAGREEGGSRRKKKKGASTQAENAGRKSSRPRKKKSKFKRFLVALVLIAAILIGGLYAVVGMVYDKMHFEPIESVAASPMKQDGVVNVLLIGNDSRENGEDGRSDAMILLSISSKTKKIYMTSLLRDMYVEIPGHDNNRLNAAYSYGGAELLMETVEQNFDIPVDRYILVNFEAFANLVDAVGGIELELTSEEIEYVNGYLVEYNMLTNRPQGTDNMDPSASGLVHLNGPQALAYSRNRYLGTDFGRTERQRKVLTAVIQKLPKAILTNPVELFNGLMPNLTTNLTKQECFRLGLMAYKLLTYEIVQTSIPIEGTYQNATIRKMAVLEVDFEANIKYLKENIYGITEE